jgi:hypothetical protein
MVDNNNFRLISKDELGRMKKVKWLENPNVEQNGIAKGNKLVSWVAYEKHDDRICIRYIWSTKNPSLVRDFRRQFEVTPAMFFAEHFIRKGTANFNTHKLFPSGSRLVSRINKAELTSPYHSFSHGHGLKISPKWTSLAKSRKRILK